MNDVPKVVMSGMKTEVSSARTPKEKWRQERTTNETPVYFGVLALICRSMSTPLENKTDYNEMNQLSLVGQLNAWVSIALLPSKLTSITSLWWNICNRNAKLKEITLIRITN